MSNDKIRCERCGKVLDPNDVRWLELSNTDGNYYEEIPFAHQSQGGFAFGKTCAARQLSETARM